jgi:DNA invertase Pin-like site-specific DNA recombinase
MKTKRCPEGLPRVVGYVRVSTQGQVASGLSLAAQVEQITQECEKRGWCLQAIERDEGRSAKTMTRDGLQAALEALAQGSADALMVSKSDRATRSVRDLYALMDASVEQGWTLVDLEAEVDTSDPTGRMLAGMRGVVSQWEREIIGKRTREALAQKRQSGVVLGRPTALAESTASYARSLRAQGLSVRKIAARLTAEAVPTACGEGKWSATQVQRIFTRG